jgi:hypothetical protein
LRAYVDREKHARVPAAHVEGGMRLGTWVNRRRMAYRRGQLTEEEAARFEALPGWTWRPSNPGR